MMSATAIAHSATHRSSGRSLSSISGWAAAPLFLVHQVKVAEDAVERKDQRQAEIVRVDFWTVSGLTL